MASVQSLKPTREEKNLSYKLSLDLLRHIHTEAHANYYFLRYASLSAKLKKHLRLQMVISRGLWLHPSHRQCWFNNSRSRGKAGCGMRLDWPAAPILGSCLLLEYPCHSVRNSVYTEDQGEEQRAGGNKQRPANNSIHEYGSRSSQ